MNDLRTIKKAFELHEQGLYREAISLYQALLKKQPNNREALFYLSIAELQNQNYKNAISSLINYIREDNQNAAAWGNLALAYNESLKFLDAKKAAERALKIAPEDISAQINLGVALRNLNFRDDSRKIFESLVKRQPESAAVWLNLFLLKIDSGEYQSILTTFEQLSEPLKSTPPLLELIGVCMLKTSNYLEAKRIFYQLIDAGYPVTSILACNLGIAELELGNLDAALSLLEQSTEMNPTSVVPLVNLGIAYNEKKNYQKALSILEVAYRLSPSYPFLLGRLIHQRMLCAKWDGLDTLKKELLLRVAAREKVAEPFGFQAICDDPLLLKICAEVYSNHEIPAVLNDSFSDIGKFTATSKIRLGFVSGEFREHATLILLIGLLEKLNRDKFEIFCFDTNFGDKSLLRARLDACCNVLSIRHLSDIEATETIKHAKIDVLFDLNGFFGERRPAIFEMRAAPIQINYLGFPGTTGRPNWDFIIADSVVIRKGEENAFSEKVIRMPNCYQPNDDKRQRPKLTISRESQNLPEHAFVYCCFNNTYKITEAVFRLWLKILKKVPDSILWLLETNSLAVRNMHDCATREGITKDRIIFASRSNNLAHLERHYLANLFLDTFPYNAHTTASDALWMELPVLSLSGNAFAGRVAESMLYSLGVSDELVAKSTQDYVEKAVLLATDEAYMRRIKQKVSEGVKKGALFDTQRYARDFEALVLSLAPLKHSRLTD